MDIRLVGHDYKYGVEQIMLLMFPEQRPVYVDRDEPEGADFVRSELSPDGRRAVTLLFVGGKSAEGEAELPAPPPSEPLLRDRECQKLVKLAFFRAAVALTGRQPPWGALTGIRPGKLAERYMRETGASEREAAEFMQREYYLTPRSASLCVRVAEEAETLRKSFSPEDISVYAGIPFCPTRCAYCSFVSQSVEKSFALIEPYLEALIKEIRAAGRITRELGLRSVSLYIGGGTPTTLSAPQLERLLGELGEQFGGSALRELTVEAGRPDTIDRERLAAISRGGAGRISINPQTMNDAVLAAIGRKHSGLAVVESFRLARECFSGDINMDLIAGLPGDCPESFAASLDEVIALAPENITVHTLAMKRGSRLISENAALPDGEAVSKMLDYASEALTAAGYSPYYLYRQKFSSGGFENIGWTKPGHTGIYNICVMEELHSVLALGAGGVTKLTDPSTGYLERISNKKYPKEYIESIDEICDNKNRMREFYAKMREGGARA